MGVREVKSVLSFQFAARILLMRDTRFHWSIVSELKGKIPFTEEGEVGLQSFIAMYEVT